MAELFRTHLASLFIFFSSFGAGSGVIDQCPCGPGCACDPCVCQVAKDCDCCAPKKTKSKKSEKDILKHIRDVSVSLEHEGRTFGSGVIFHKDGHAFCLTANHCVTAADGKRIRVVQHFGSDKGIFCFGEPVAAYPDTDHAVLKMLSDGVFKHGAKVCRKKHGLDTPIYHCGSMHGQDHSMTRGWINGIDRTSGDGMKLDQADITASFGSSGGGVFAVNGDLIGIVVRGFPQRIVFFSPVRNMEYFGK